MTGRKEYQKRKSEENWGRLYAEGGEPREMLEGRPVALVAYDKRQREMQREGLEALEREQNDGN